MPDKTSKTNHDADVAFIKALAEVLNDNDLTELEASPTRLSPTYGRSGEAS